MNAMLFFNILYFFSIVYEHVFWLKHEKKLYNVCKKGVDDDNECCGGGAGRV